MAGAHKKRQIAARRSKQNESPKQDSSPSSSGANTSSPRPLSSPGAFDGNRDPATPQPRPGADGTPPVAPQGGGQVMATRVQNKNLDLGAMVSGMMSGFGASTNLPARPKQVNRTGRELSVKLNTFGVTRYPQKEVYQYDVIIGSGNEKSGLIKRVWGSSSLQKLLGNDWIFDGKKLAWSLSNVGSKEKTIDLDAEAGRTPRKDDKGNDVPDKYRVALKMTKVIKFDKLAAWLAKKTDFGDECLEAINFLDHLLRDTPSRKYTVQKRSFFRRGQERFRLGGGVEAFRGVYASLRPVNNGLNASAGLSVNVDVANTTFWIETALHLSAKDLLNARDINHVASLIGPGRPDPKALYQMKKFSKVGVYVKHRGKEAEEESKNRPLIIDRFLSDTANTRKVDIKDANGVERPMTVAQYFQQKYNVRLQYPDLPVVQMTKKHVIMPMELCFIKENQRYGAKLDERQTSEMIKFAVTLPNQRWAHIQEGLNMLDWSGDPKLSSFGLQMANNATTVNATLLPNPNVQFKDGSQQNPVDPKTTGRWDLRGKKFMNPSPQRLTSWGVCVLPGRFACSKEQVEVFVRSLVSALTGHGLTIANNRPPIQQGSQDPKNSVRTIWSAAGSQEAKDQNGQPLPKSKPQILFFVVPDKNSLTYQLIKQACETEFGVVSQVMQARHVQENKPQYISNVCMKINAKLGGITAMAAGLKGPNSWFKVPTVVIGADVSHGAPGTLAPSIAAMTMSNDRKAVQYLARVQTNGCRTEMISRENIFKLLGPMIENWKQKVAGGSWPHHVIYVRDGVSEGQYAQVLNSEVKDMREMLHSLDTNCRPKITVVTATKRHHVRFFPTGQNGDRNNNPLPGTLVESGVTHPFEYDFYLCAHSAIKGTARPVHYHVLLDEAEMSLENLQNWLYECSYQFVRSTTPVSMFPAAYYAHLAAGRATAHIEDLGKDDISSVSSGKTREAVEIRPLRAIPEGSNVLHTMWYV